MAMTYLTCTLKSGLSLLIIPDCDAHMDGHPVITWTYSIYRNDNLFDDDLSNEEAPVYSEKYQLKEKETSLHLEKKLDDCYLGYITIEQFEEKIFYTPDGEEELSYVEVEEAIEQIINYRSNSKTWKY